MQKLDLESKSWSKYADTKLKHAIVDCVKKNSKRILSYCRFELANSMDSKNHSRKLEKSSEIVQAKVKNNNSLNSKFSNSTSTVKNSEYVFPSSSIKLNQFVTYSAFNNFGRTTLIWSYLEIFRIIFGQKIEIFKIALPAPL